MEKIDSLRLAIDNNQNLNKEFKENVKSLTDTLVTVLPGYDYTNFSNALSTLKISNGEGENYSDYDINENKLSLNIDKINEDNIDPQHLFFHDMLLIGSNAYKSDEVYSSLNNGTAELITNLMNADAGKKIYPIELHEASILSKMVSPEILLNSFMTQNYSDMFLEMEQNGISKEDTMSLLNSMNAGKSNFANTEGLMLDMYSKVLNTQLANQELELEDVNTIYDDFKNQLIFNRFDLMIMYPNQDFNNIEGFDKLNDLANNINFKTNKEEFTK